MEIWIVEDGGKKGPYETYLLRERIEAGELSGDELAWHKDQDGWVSLREMDASGRHLRRGGRSRPFATPFPSNRIPIRFRAWFDVTLPASSASCCGAWVTTPSGALQPVPFSTFFPTFCWSRHASPDRASPGRYLWESGLPPLMNSSLGCRQRSFARAGLHRGFGPHGAPLLTGICHVYCVSYLMRHNKAPWDKMTSTRVETKDYGVPWIRSLLFLTVECF